jgi:SAM-dependent methyltransferase
MKWSQVEIEQLLPILEQVQADLEPLEEKNLLVLCCAAGEVAFWLGERVKHSTVTGVELNLELLEYARSLARKKGLEDRLAFQPVEKKRIPLPDEIFDGLVSEFIIFPTPTPTEIGQPEMARVLKKGGKMVLTDVILIRPLPQNVRDELQAIGLDYLCDGTQDDFKNWMAEAGLKNVKVIDFTPVVRKVWEQKREADRLLEHKKGYSYLLDDPYFGLGIAIFYIYVYGEKE